MTVKPPKKAAFYIDGHACSVPTLAPGLYVTSTPIGNLADITLRALQVLAAADLVLCEDTRVTRKLTQKYGIEAILRPYHDHNAEKVRPDIVNKLLSGSSVALVSDAGTPLVSDPGFKLVREATAQDIVVTAIPGASAPMAALAIAGLPSDRILFAGFPPPKKGQRQAFFQDFHDVPATLVFFASARAIAAVLADIEETLGDRPAVIARELTKLYEEVLRGDVSELREIVKTRTLKGEVTLLVAGPPGTQEMDAGLIDLEITRLLRSKSVRDVAAELAKAHNVPRRQVYLRALEIARSQPDAG